MQENYSDLGAVAVDDYSDLGAIPIASKKQKKESSFLSQVGDYLWPKLPKPQGLSKNITRQDMEGMLSAAIGGPGMKIAGAAKELPRIIQQFISHGTGALVGGDVGEKIGHPVEGAIAGALLPFSAKPFAAGIDVLAGTKAGQTVLSNQLLKRILGQSKKGGALTPEEAKQRLESSYTTAEGKPMAVGIGELTNEPAASTMEGILGVTPGSNVRQQKNILAGQLHEKNISDIQHKLQQEEEKILAKKQENEDLGYFIQQEKQPNIAQQEHIVQKQNVNQQSINSLSQALQGIREQKASSGALIENVPKQLNVLPALTGEAKQFATQPASLPRQLKEATRSAYQEQKGIAKEKYAGLDREDIRLDKMKDSDLTDYKSTARDLLANRENLENLFGKGSSLGEKLNRQIAAAETYIASGKDYALSLKDAVHQVRTLGELSSKAFSQGNRNEARLIGNLRDSLSGDVDRILRDNEQGNIADQLAEANTHYREHVVPFWQNREIRQSVENKNYVPGADKLAKALHDENNQSILFKLKPEAQKTALYQLLTKGEGTAEGVSTLSPEEIAGRYRKIPVTAKAAIKQYSPEGNSLFESLSQKLREHEHYQKQESALEKQLDAIMKENERLDRSHAILEKKNEQIEKRAGKMKQPSTKKHESLQKALMKAQQEKLGQKKQPSALGMALKTGGIATGAGTVGLTAMMAPKILAGALPVALTGRTLSKALTNPELIQAYIKGQKLTSKSGIEDFLRQALSRGAIAGANQGNQYGS